MKDILKNEAQKYKVFHNLRALEIRQLKTGEKKSKPKLDVLAAVEFLKQSSDFGNMEIDVLNPTAFFNELKSCFFEIKAAGGLVLNSESLLVIKRNGVWDLPKGKVEKNEQLEQAAIREVQEECGLKQIYLRELTEITYHIYFREKWVFKPTYWYSMETSETLVNPQLEEGITDICWMTKNDVEKIIETTFPSLKPVFTRFLTLKTSV